MTSYSQFKELYNNDPVFRNKLKDYKNEKIRCPNGCGQVVSGSNMSAHKRSTTCRKFVEENVDITTNEINKLKDRVDALEKILKKVAEE